MTELSPTAQVGRGDELVEGRDRAGWCGIPQHGLSSNNMALITSDCDKIFSPRIKWP